MLPACSPIKKRGRKKKEQPQNIQIILEETISDKSQLQITEDVIAPIMKKRGRKPKGGKLINKNMIKSEENLLSTNIILHLKCYLKDIDTDNVNNTQINDPLSYNPCVPPDIMTYDVNKHGFSYYDGCRAVNEDIKEEYKTDNKFAYTESLCKNCKCNIKDDDGINDTASLAQDTESEDYKISLKDINTKLKKLRIQFYKNNINDKKSACFWCSYDFDNQPCYIPKYEIDDSICGYGSFCRPECAVGFLMKENIDDSTKFERYHILNQIYSKVYGYKKNIKPAPNPYYLLDKYYGTLTIQEYRKLLKTEHMLLVIDKPLTRILPELHDDNDEFYLNIYGGIKTSQATATGGIYKVKRQSEKTQGPTKNSIIKDKFGLS